VEAILIKHLEKFLSVFEGYLYIRKYHSSIIDSPEDWEGFKTS
jgi:hypothetical protein